MALRIAQNLWAINQLLLKLNNYNLNILTLRKYNLNTYFNIEKLACLISKREDTWLDYNFEYSEVCAHTFEVSFTNILLELFLQITLRYWKIW